MNKRRIQNSIDETHKAYESGYSELQETSHSLRRSVSDNQSIDENLIISKDIYLYLIHPQMPTNNDLRGQMLIQFGNTFEKLNELKALFEEKGKLSSSKGGKDSRSSG